MRAMIYESCEPKVKSSIDRFRFHLRVLEIENYFKNRMWGRVGKTENLHELPSTIELDCSKENHHRVFSAAANSDW